MAGDRYRAYITAAVANPRTIGTIMALTTGRAYIERVTMSIIDTPADNTIEWTIGRITTAGTVSAVTPIPDDPLVTAASRFTTGQNATVEPTYLSGGTMFKLGLNQRSPYTLDIRGIEWPTDYTATHGYGIKALHASVTSPAAVILEWVE